MNRLATVAAIALTVAGLSVAPAAAEPLADIGQAIHCGFLEGAGSSFVDPNCGDNQSQSRTWESGPYSTRQACEQAGRQAVADGRAKSYRCYLGHSTYKLHASR